ncbi:MAG: hypothetical protein K6G52_00435 [Treponemataceae bacterium]|nr:hypothetical protein [Treponemataceae bacterium]
MIFKKQAPKILVTGILLCLFSFSGYSQTNSSYLELSQVLDEATMEKLLSKKVLRNFSVFEKERKLIYAPNVPDADIGLNKWNENHDYEPNYVLENLYYFDLKDEIGVSKQNPSKEQEFIKLNKLVRSMSKMTGLKYFSHTRHKMDVLYDRCYAIDNPKTKNRIDDVLDTSVNPIYVLFDDNSFGEYVGELTYGQGENEIYLTEVNQNPLGLPGLKAIKNKDLCAFVDMVPCKDAIVVYVLIEAKVGVPAGFKNMILESFTTRSDAIFNWIKSIY